MLRIPLADHRRIARRSLMAGAGGLLLCGAGPSGPASLAALEADQALRLGIAVLDTGTGRMSGHRKGERFGLCSTFKLFLAGLVLQAADRGELNLGDVLAPATRAKLARWMEDTSTGLRRLRAGAPAGWRIGDKTGTGHGRGRPSRINDIAVAWPPHRAPLVVAAYLEMPTAEDFVAAHEAMLAEAMRIAMLPYVQA